MPVSTARGVRSVFRVVTSLAPPFVMEGELDEDGQCLRGLECHRLLTSDKDNLTLVFNEMERLEDAEEESEVPERDFWAKDIFQNSRLEPFSLFAKRYKVEQSGWLELTSIIFIIFEIFSDYFFTGTNDRQVEREID